MPEFVPVVPADGGIHPKVKAGAIVGTVVTVLVALLGVLGVDLPVDAGALTDALLVLVGVASTLVAAYRKAAR